MVSFLHQLSGLKHKLVATTVFLLIWISAAVNANACVCDEPMTLSEGLTYTDVVFSGRVVGMGKIGGADTMGIVVTRDSALSRTKSRMEPVFVVFCVDSLYKGVVKYDTIVILTPPDRTSCGYSFSREKTISYTAYPVGEAVSRAIFT